MRADFLRDSTGDLAENPVTGDWILGQSDGQHIEDILRIEPGSLFYSPLTGVGVTKKINGPADAGLFRIIQMQLEADGYSARSISFLNESIVIDAYVKS